MGIDELELRDGAFDGSLPAGVIDPGNRVMRGDRRAGHRESERYQPCGCLSLIGDVEACLAIARLLAARSPVKRPV